MMLPTVAWADWFKAVIVSCALSPGCSLPTADSGTSTFACIGPDSLTDISGENELTACAAEACAGGGNSEKDGPGSATDCGPAKSRTPDSPTRSPMTPFTTATMPSTGERIINCSTDVSYTATWAFA